MREVFVELLKRKKSEIIAVNNLNWKQEAG